MPKFGPPGRRKNHPINTIITQGRHFRMRNEAGKVCYTGYIIGQFEGQAYIPVLMDNRQISAWEKDNDGKRIDRSWLRAEVRLRAASWRLG